MQILCLCSRVQLYVFQQVTNLRKERENMLERQQKESSSDSQHLRAVQKENIQLNLKVKSLLSELEEIRAQREQTGLQADSITRLQVKQMTELQSNLKAIEVKLKRHTFILSRIYTYNHVVLCMYISLFGLTSIS